MTQPGCRGRAAQGAEAPGAAEELAQHGPSAHKPRAPETVEKVEIVIGKSWENCDFTGQNEGFYMNLCGFIFFCIKHVSSLIGRSEDVMGKYWGNRTQTNGAI